MPVIHIQNVSQPFAYPGISEVEPLIPLQDELNTRLCDRASRVTMQSFKMFLAKGIDGFDKSPVGPGQVWATDNIEAKVESFGGDAGAPGEDEHIEQIREALDKASGVPPLASGVVRAKIGNLTSENALRVTLMGLLSKTARKRVSYGRGLAEVSRLVLTALNEAGILRTSPSDRGVRVEWPDPLPRDEKDLLTAAKAKIELGIPRERVLSELGYSPNDPGIV
ncbi:MAG: phage portal protein [Pyrinomonadaceae bacterium]|nr:phage portal protein [Phycisphaerales bacterium]